MKAILGGCQGRGGGELAVLVSLIFGIFLRGMRKNGLFLRGAGQCVSTFDLFYYKYWYSQLTSSIRGGRGINGIALGLGGIPDECDRDARRLA